MDSRRQELGEFLQALRGRCAPAAFGFPEGRRRTQGLRREEVAQLAGISATWYTWIEQGREVNVSSEALDRLAQALKLSRSERAYLFEMAGRRDPHGVEQEEDTVPGALTVALDSTIIPAYIMGRYWDLLAWNRPAAELFSGWLDQPRKAGDVPPNLLRFVFQMPESRQFVVSWETRARRLVAEFRADCRSRLDDPALQRLVSELSQSSPEFAQFWKQHDVLERQGGERAFHHPARGLIAFQQVTLHPVDQEHLKLVLLAPAQDSATGVGGDAAPVKGV
jgi:transcriptional regulator with XRE-family HTH domain